jgi:hypothetical protein
VVEDDSDGRRSRREAVGVDDAGADPKAVGARIRLSASSVEPVYGLGPGVRVAELSEDYVDRGRPDPRHQQCWTIVAPERTSVPVWLPCQRLHPQLRCSPSWAGLCGRAGSSA